VFRPGPPNRLISCAQSLWRVVRYVLEQGSYAGHDLPRSGPLLSIASRPPPLLLVTTCGRRARRKTKKHKSWPHLLAGIPWSMQRWCWALFALISVVLVKVDAQALTTSSIVQSGAGTSNSVTLAAPSQPGNFILVATGGPPSASVTSTPPESWRMLGFANDLRTSSSELSWWGAIMQAPGMAWSVVCALCCALDVSLRPHHCQLQYWGSMWEVGRPLFGLQK
jgi:hypothetical protein